MGVNFWSRTGGPLMWRNYDGAVIDAELEDMRTHGMTLTRSFFYWPDFHPHPDQLDETMIERYRDFLDRHHAKGMVTIPTFIVGHMSGQNWDPVWRDGRNLYTDVYFVGRQAWYVRELTKRFHDHPAVAGWLLTNEMPIYGDWRSRGNSAPDPDAIISWAQILIDAVRAGGGTQPVSIGEGAWGVEITGNDNGFRVRDVANLVDFLGPHVYRMETDQARQFLGAAYVCEQLQRHGLPVVMEEFGVTSEYTSDENGAHYYRQLLHHTLLAGSTGWIAWNNTDYDEIYRQAPYTHRPFELHFGLFDKHGKAKPQAVEMRKFREVLDTIDVTRCRRPDTQAAFVVTAYLDNQYPFTQPEDGPTATATLLQSYVAARFAHLPIGFIREADGLSWRPGTPRDLKDGVQHTYAGEHEPAEVGPGLPTDVQLYLVPSTKHLTSPTWFQLEELVRNGKNLYASYFLGTHTNQRGPWWPNMHELFGVRKLTRYGLVDPIEDDVVEFHFKQDFGGIAAGEVLSWRTAGTENSRAYLPVDVVEGDVVAVDQHGRPALVRHRLGQGAAILNTYPVEHMGAVSARVNPDSTARLYAALAADAGVAPDITVPGQQVITGELVHEDGRRFVWLINMTDAEVTVSPALRDGATARTLAGAPASDVTLGAWDVEVLQLG